LNKTLFCPLELSFFGCVFYRICVLTDTGIGNDSASSVASELMGRMTTSGAMVALASSFIPFSKINIHNIVVNKSSNCPDNS
jgi:hypothetical protein